MIGTLTWDIRAAGVTLPVLDAGSINIDDQNVPAITASVVVPYAGQALLEALDPRVTDVPRVMLNGEMSHWTSQPISAMTDYVTTNGVTTIAGLSALWTGKQLRDVSALFGSALHAGAIDDNPIERMSLDLHVRELEYDEREQTMTVSLASDEALLTDWSATSSADTDAFVEIRAGMNHQQIKAWVDPTLKVVLGYGIDTTVYDTSALSQLYTDILTPIRETDAWNYMRPFLDDTDLKLRVGRTGRGFTLQRPENELPGKVWLSLFRASEVISVKQRYSRTGEWYDSAELHRPAAEGDSAGYPIGVHSRTYMEDFAGRKPSVSMAQNIERRSVNRGRFIDMVAPIRLGVFMRDEFAYIPEDGVPQQWTVKSVTYDVPAGTMTIRGEQRY